MMRRRIGAALAALSLVVLAFCGWCGYSWIVDYQESAGRLKEIGSVYVKEAGLDENRTEEAGEAAETMEQDSSSGQKPARGKKHKSPVKVDWKGLKEEVSCVVAWIDIPGLGLSYPVVQGEDNDYYLHHNIDGEPSGYGAIFLNYDSPVDFSDSNSIVYGHNMNDGSMFRKINYYEDPDTFRKAPDIYICTPDGRTLCYRVFSVYQSPADDASFRYGNRLGTRDYWRQQEAIRRQSEYETGTAISPDKPMLTLKTCNTRLDYGTRTSVSAILLWEEQETT